MPSTNELILNSDKATPRRVSKDARF